MAFRDPDAAAIRISGLTETATSASGQLRVLGTRTSVESLVTRWTLGESYDVLTEDWSAAPVELWELLKALEDDERR